MELLHDGGGDCGNEIEQLHEETSNLSFLIINNLLLPVLREGAVHPIDNYRDDDVGDEPESHNQCQNDVDQHDENLLIELYCKIYYTKFFKKNQIM